MDRYKYDKSKYEEDRKINERTARINVKRSGGNKVLKGERDIHCFSV